MEVSTVNYKKVNHWVISWFDIWIMNYKSDAGVNSVIKSQGIMRKGSRVMNKLLTMSRKEIIIMFERD